MELRLEKLRDQLERRMEAKNTLLSLELNRISNEAEGLVWPAQQGGAIGGMGGIRAGMSGGGVYGGMLGGGGGRSGAFSGGVTSGGLMDGSGMGGVIDSRAGVGAIGGPAMGNSGPSGQTTSRTNLSLKYADTDETESEQVQDKLRAIALACLNYESAYQKFPSNIVDADKKPLLSWRVAILPFLGDEGQELYEKFKLDEPWNSEHNVGLLADMPETFKAPGASLLKTTILGFDGPGAIFESGESVRFGKITDGSSNTILAVHADRQSAITWTKPADIQFYPKEPVTQLAESEDGTVNAVLCDGSNVDVKAEAIQSDLNNLIQKDDGKVINLRR